MKLKYYKIIAKKYSFFSLIITISIILSNCSFYEQKLESSSQVYILPLKTNIEKKIKDSTVLIKRGSEYSSGIIIRRIKNKVKNNYTYIILTARHSVKKTQSEISISTTTPNLEIICPKEYQRKTKKYSEVTCAFGFYHIYTNDGKKHYIDYSDIDKEYSKKWDLAIIKFESEDKYRSVSIFPKQQVQKNIPVYVSGYRGCGRPEIEMNNNYELTSGIVKKNSNKSSKILYTNSTINGMSGGGVFNEQGKLIAIHQRANNKKQYDNKNCLPLKKQGNNLGDNWGTFASDFLNEEEIAEKFYNTCLGLSPNAQCPRE